MNLLGVMIKLSRNYITDLQEETEYGENFNRG